VLDPFLLQVFPSMGSIPTLNGPREPRDPR
jgi:hypothetical protein